MSSISGPLSFLVCPAAYCRIPSLTLLWNGNFTLTWTHTVMGSSFTCLLLGIHEEFRNFLLYIKPYRCPQLNNDSTYNGSKSNIHSEETIFQILNCNFFWLMICSRLWSPNAGQAVCTAPVTHTMMNENNKYTYNHPVFILPFCFTLPIWCSINCMMCHTLL